MTCHCQWGCVWRESPPHTILALRLPKRDRWSIRLSRRSRCLYPQKTTRSVDGWLIDPFITLSLSLLSLFPPKCPYRRKNHSVSVDRSIDPSQTLSLFLSPFWLSCRLSPPSLPLAPSLQPPSLFTYLACGFKATTIIHKLHSQFKSTLISCVLFFFVHLCVTFYARFREDDLLKIP